MNTINTQRIGGFLSNYSLVCWLMIMVVASFVLPFTSLWAQAGQCLSGNCVSGTGTFRWSEGNLYQGRWRNSLPNGRGTMSYAKGNRYTGQWQSGLWQGQGRLTYADGSYYEGNFLKGLISGRGRRVFANGRQYEGNWQKNRWNGRGILTWKDGAKYTGEFRAGKIVKSGTYLPGVYGPGASAAGRNQKPRSIEWGGSGSNRRVCLLKKCTKRRSLYLTASGQRSIIAAQQDQGSRARVVDWEWEKTNIELTSKSRTSGLFLFHFPEIANINHGFLPSRLNARTLADVTNGFGFTFIFGRSSKPKHNLEITFLNTTYENESYFRGQINFRRAFLENYLFGYAYIHTFPRRVRIEKGSSKKIRGSQSVGVSTGLAIRRNSFSRPNLQQTFPIAQQNGANFAEVVLGNYIAFHYLAGFATKSGKYESVVGLTLRATFHFATNFNRTALAVDPTNAAPNNSFSFHVNLGSRF